MNLFYAAVGGFIFNIANVLLIAGIEIVGLAVAFPLSIGIALPLTTNSCAWVRHSFCHAPDLRPDSYRLLRRLATTPSRPCSFAGAIIRAAEMLKVSLTCTRSDVPRASRRSCWRSMSGSMRTSRPASIRMFEREEDHGCVAGP